MSDTVSDEGLDDDLSLKDNDDVPVTDELGEDYVGSPGSAPQHTLQYMSELDSDQLQRLREYYPSLLGNPHQIFGYLHPKEYKRVRLLQRKLIILGRMRRGRSDLNKFYDSAQAEYVAEREVMRSYEGWERSAANTTQQVQYQVQEEPKKRGFLDRFLLRSGPKR